MVKQISVAVCAILLTVAVTAYSQDTGVEKPALDFSAGSIIEVSTVAHSELGSYGIYIERPEVRKLGDTWFIVGTVPNIPGFPKIGQRVWVAMSSVLMINEHKDIDEIQQLFATHPSPNK